MFETNGTSEHPERVCTLSIHKKNPCKRKDCTHHRCHVKVTQSGTEYRVRKPSQLDKCLIRKER